MKVVEMVITPEQAQKWLDEKFLVNRFVRSTTIDQYARAMKAGKWDLTANPIQFDKEGMILDGHHRLSAIVKAGVPVKMMVATGCDRSMYVDSGMRRNDSDRIKMSNIGIDSMYTCSAIIAVTKLFGGNSNSKVIMQHQLNADEIIDNISLYESSFRVAHNFYKTTNKKNFFSSPVLLAMIAALESGESVEAVSRWAEIVSTGEYDSQIKAELSVIKYREKHANEIVGRASQSDRMYLFRLACSSIEHFARGEFVSKVMERPCYPIPELAAKKRSTQLQGDI